jgi:hypothetical protein
MGVIILSALVAHTGWHWMLERADRLRQYRVQWPEWNLAMASAILRVLSVAVFLAGLAWWVASWQKRRAETAARPPVEGPTGGPPQSVPPNPLG